jgi:hypothetical protein
MVNDDPRRPNRGFSPLLLWGIVGILVIALFVLLAGVLF